MTDQLANMADAPHYNKAAGAVTSHSLHLITGDLQLDSHLIVRRCLSPFTDQTKLSQVDATESFKTD